MNKVVLIGRTTSDIELRYTTNQTAVTRFNLAVDRRTKEDGTDFITCKAWGKTAELLEKYINKGDRIGIEGRIETGSYEKDGRKIYTTEVVVESIEFLTAKKETPAQSQQTPATGFTDAEPVDDAKLPF